MTTGSIEAVLTARENLTRDDARARAAAIADVQATVHLDLRRGHEVFGSRTELRFRVVSPTETFVDVSAVELSLVQVDGVVLDPSAGSATRYVLPAMEIGDHVVVVEGTMAYRREGLGLHRFVDPTDGRVYLHTQFEPFEAHKVFACFDQPDLKTVLTFSVDAPEGFVVVSNAEAVERPVADAPGVWAFAPTPPISPYIAAIVAGPYQSVHDEYTREDGRSTPLGIYVRRSLARYLDADELFELTKQSFRALESMFGQTYPFGKYDQLFVPEFNFGAMENPGCVTFSETYVFRSKVTDAQRERRAETLIHEMAHMWFGDLVTMRWWDDLWLNESFATFTSVLVQATATRWDCAWVTFLDAEKTWAKFQDQLPSTHPIADEMPDTESVHQNFDGITYAKGAAVLRQLAAWVGQDAFLAGCRDYFERHAWGNTELPDFLAALERASGRDLAAWSDEWLRTTGITTLGPRFEIAEDGTYADFAVEQTSAPASWACLPDVDGSAPALRRHRVAIGLYQESAEGLLRTDRVELDVVAASTPVPALVGRPAADVVLVNDDDLTYAKTTLDDATMAVVTRALSSFTTPLPRALVWSSAWDMVRDATLPAGAFLDLVQRNVAAEDQVGVLQRLLARAVGAVYRYGDPDARGRRAGALAHHARTALEAAAPGSGHQLAWARHWASVASGDGDELARVRALLDGSAQLTGLSIDTDLRWQLLTALSQAGVADDEDIAAELRRDDTDLGQRHAATARAARPTAASKEWAWRTLLEDRALSHTMTRQILAGFAQLDQSEVLAPFASRYFEVLDEVWEQRSLEWATEFSAGAFPHASTGPELLERVDAFLARRDLPRPLRRILLEQRDTLVRTLDARALDAKQA